MSSKKKSMKTTSELGPPRPGCSAYFIGPVIVYAAWWAFSVMGATSITTRALTTTFTWRWVTPFLFGVNAAWLIVAIVLAACGVPRQKGSTSNKGYYSPSHFEPFIAFSVWSTALATVLLAFHFDLLSIFGRPALDAYDVNPNDASLSADLVSALNTCNLIFLLAPVLLAPLFSRLASREWNPIYEKNVETEYTQEE